MKVFFDYPQPQYSPHFGVRLEPGENEVGDEVGEKMLKCGLVSPARPSTKADTEPQFPTTLDEPAEKEPEKPSEKGAESGTTKERTPPWRRTRKPKSNKEE